MPLVRTMTVNEKTRIQKERTLILQGIVHVKPGDSVEPESIIARTKLYKGEPIRVRATAQLGMAARKIQQALTVKVGDEVEKGQIIAAYTRGKGSKTVLESPCSGVIEHISQTKGELQIREIYSDENTLETIDVAKQLGIIPMFMKTFMHVREGQWVDHNDVLASIDGFVSNAVRSPVWGTVEKICSRTGTVSIRRPYGPTNVHAYLAGKVNRIIPEYGAVIETSACYIEGCFGIGGETFGRLVVATETSDDVLTPDKISGAHAAAILVAGSGVTYEALKKAQDLNVRGIIAGGVHSGDMMRLTGKEIAVGITGQEDTGLSVVALQGFGIVPMIDSAFALFKQHEGKTVSMNGATRIQAGVVRPEIIIPLEQAVESLVESDAPNQTVEPLPGVRVRLIGDPFYGCVGTIVSNRRKQKTYRSGVTLSTLTVLLDEGGEVDVPETNVAVFDF